MRYSRNRVRYVVSGIALSLCALRNVEGQTRPTAVVPSGTSSSVPSSAGPLITADFTESKTSLDRNLSRGLRFCQEVFRDTLLNHPDDVRNGADHQFSPVAIAAGRRCLHDIGGGDRLPASDWVFLLRFAIALNDDSLAERVVTRQLAAAGPTAGPSVRDHAKVLENAIVRLVHNPWPEVYRGMGAPPDHPTIAHTALARQYSAQLDAMQPAAQVVATRLRVFDQLHRLDTTVWNVDTELDKIRQRFQIATSVPLSAVPDEDRAFVHMTPLALTRLTYLKTPTHANLLRWVAVRDSLFHGPHGEISDSLIGHSAARLACNYWFNLPVGVSAPIVPAPGVTSLLLLGEDFTPQTVTRLQHLHAQYPTLQIVVVAMTHGQYDGQDLREQPAEEAALLHEHLTSMLRLPGTVCVLQTQYHTEPGMTAIPIVSSILDRYRLDPRSYAHHAFLVDTDGWIVEDRWDDVLDGKLIQRLLAH